MSNVFVDNENVKVSCSPFAVFSNEEAVLEGKERFDFKFVELEKIKAIDKELIHTIYVLRYSTSRQLTEYLNRYRGIDIHQRDVTRMLNQYKRQRIAIRYGFKSDNRTEEVGTKAYALAENGRHILKSTPFGCDWVRTDSFDVENIKKYLARNQFILKFSENFTDINWNSDISGVAGSITYNSSKHHVVPVR
ncbi:MAG: hypothetical protein ACRDA5_10420, partial [Clostridium sp.]